MFFLFLFISTQIHLWIMKIKAQKMIVAQILAGGYGLLHTNRHANLMAAFKYTIRNKQHSGFNNVDANSPNSYF
jgi:hypothetical protein